MDSDLSLDSVGQAEPNQRSRKPHIQAIGQAMPDPLPNIDRELLDTLGIPGRLRLINNKSVCLAEPLNAAGLHRVTMVRQPGPYTAEFHLDNAQECADFIVAAIGELCLPGEDPNAMRREFRDLLYAKLSDYVESTSHMMLEPLSEIVPAEVEWLWPGFIAADKLALLVGEPGVGKTLTALDIAARVTTGAPWPTDPPGTERRKPASVILLSEMDDSADTLRPRLAAVGADLNRVHLLRTYIKVDGSRAVLPFSVGGNLDMLADCVNKVSDCQLVVIDPLSLYVEGSLNRREITMLLGSLIELAVKKRLAILVVSHTGRAQFHYSSQVTARFAAAARTVWRVVDDRRETGRRVLVPLKNNLGTDREGLAFKIEEVDALYPAPRVVWEARQLEFEVQRSTFETERQNGPKALGSRRRQRQSACEWLRSQLIAGGMLARQVKEAAEQEQIGIKLLRSALDQIGGISHRGPTGHYIWFLPESMSSAQRQALNLEGTRNEKCVGTQDFRDFQELQDFQDAQTEIVRPNADAAA